MKSFRIKIIVIVLFIFQFEYAQTLEKIKSVDTVYIYFDHSDFQKMKKPDENSFKILEEARIYEIRFDSINYINLSERKYKDFDHVEMGKKMGKKIVLRKQLKEMKDSIIDINFIKKYGLKEVYFTIHNKRIFLIDSKEISKQKAIVKEVAFGLVSYTFEE